MEKDLIPIENMIYEIRGFKVMLDSDLAELYGTEARTLNQAVKRNLNRFPHDFMFQLNGAEWENLRSQFVIFKNDIRKFRPYAFTEHGVLMLSSVLRSDKAIEVNIEIMRIFTKVRHHALSQIGLQEQIAEIKKVLLLQIDYTDEKFKYYDNKIDDIITALNYFTEDRTSPKRQIGFNTDLDTKTEKKNNKP